MEGQDQFGKTEAWHILDSEPDAKLIAGLKPNTSPELVAESIRNGTIIDHVQYVNVKQGDTVFMPAGTLHALGPGLLVYEVQQTSDWTYRVYDWGRHATEKRPLHIEKSIRATRADFAALVMPPPATDDGTRNLLVESNYFTLEMLSATSNTIELDTAAETFHAITLIEGKARLQTGDEGVELDKFQTAVVPAHVGSYHFQPLMDCRALKSSA